ncbi:hypothetical protein N7474_000105 [Penicillium riverlandense]|uniref:uncharacterized protein n=1 Tax=Penicillium riverlandense TaxID=1903569 RepID=UPI0025469A7D|nr:uncharacterized protein N7474_000105 [Penicillium riverlandense]KAJ5831794.1 hypothetical protein N7474_000105 [Penicillium riverlandense]
MTSGKESFLDYLVQHTTGISEFHCEIGRYLFSGQDCDLTETAQGCNTAPISNPQNWALIYGIRNFHNWVNGMLTAIDSAQTNMNTMNGYMQAYFTTHNFTLAAQTYQNSLVSGSMSALSGLLTLAKLALPELNAITAAGALATLGGAGATMDTGILGSIMSETVGVIETQLKEIGNMDKWLYHVFEAMRYAVIDWGNSTINGIAYFSEDDMYYYLDPSGVVDWLNGGAFAQDISETYQLTIDNAAMKSVFAVAVSDLWVQEEVFIVNTTDAWTFTGDDYATLNIDKNDMTRVTYNDQVYFFVKNTDGAAPDSAYDPVPGIDNLKELGLSTTEVIEASAYTLNHIGFNSTWDPKGALSAMTSDDPPPGGLFMNIPICQLGILEAPSVDLFTQGCSTVDIAAECDFKRYINWSCSKQIQTTNGVVQPWPYKMYDPDWN